MTPDSPQGGGAWPGNKPQSHSGAKAESRSADARWGLRRHGRKSRGQGGPRGPERTERPPGFVSLTGMPSPPASFFTPRRCSAGLGGHRCTGAESEKTPPSRAPPGLAGGGRPSTPLAALHLRRPPASRSQGPGLCRLHGENRTWCSLEASLRSRAQPPRSVSPSLPGGTGVSRPERGWGRGRGRPGAPCWGTRAGWLR